MLKLFNTTQREQGEPQEIQVPGTPTEEEINPLNAAIIYMVTLNFRSSRQPYIYMFVTSSCAFCAKLKSLTQFEGRPLHGKC